MNSSTKQPKILVVEDDPDIQHVLCVYLTCSSFQVCAVSDGQAAINIIPEYRPDLIVLDIMIAPVSGWEVLHWLQSQDALIEEVPLRQIPVLVLSALTPLKEQIHGFEAGATEYMTKPAQPALLVERIRAILSLSAEQRTMRQHKRMNEQRDVLDRINTPPSDL